MYAGENERADAAFIPKMSGIVIGLPEALKAGGTQDMMKVQEKVRRVLLTGRVSPGTHGLSPGQQ